MSLRDAFLYQAEACAGLDSPFMARLLTGLADSWTGNGALGQACALYTGDIGPSGASLPLRIAGGLHALVLTGRAPELAAVYPPRQTDDMTLHTTVTQALATHDAFMTDWIGSAPQTNEVRRSVALIAAAHWLADRYRMPFHLSELGASGGLNMMFDRYALEIDGTVFGPSNPALTLTPDWDGPLPPTADVHVTERRGVDLNPLDPHTPDDALRLRAFLWPDQPHRMALTEAAIAAHDAVIDREDAIGWLEQRMIPQRSGALHLIYHTVAWQYFPEDRQRAGTQLIEAAGAGATDDAPLAWLSMENDGAMKGAALTLRLWPGDLTIHLGRADFHGRWVHWTAP